VTRRLHYFEDLQPGQQFETDTCTVTKGDIVRFAREFRRQPVHLDDEAARASFFGGLVASGWHTAALTMRLMVDRGPRFAGGILGVGGEISWRLPVRPGDTLQVHSEVVATTPSRSRGDVGIVTLRSDSRNQRGEIVQTFVARLLVQRRAISGE
jgi:acyl dehydratase